jgi:hypothetical protein
MELFLLHVRCFHLTLREWCLVSSPLLVFSLRKVSATNIDGQEFFGRLNRLEFTPRDSGGTRQPTAQSTAGSNALPPSLTKATPNNGG